MLPTETRDVLFAVIRCGLEQEIPSLQPTKEICDELLQIGSRQAICPILFNGLNRMDPENKMWAAFDRARMEDVRNAIQREEMLSRIEAALEKHQIPYVLLKGAVIQHLYPDPMMRTSGDIDILVHESELEKAVQAIERDTDFRTTYLEYHDVSMVNYNVHFELHFSIKENEEKIDKYLKDAWHYTQRSGEGYRCDFVPEFQIFYVIAHMYHHFLHGGLGIRPFLDLWLLRRKTFYNEETVLKMCSDSGILTFYQECCRLSQVWLEKEPHTEATALLEEFCLSGGVFGSPEFMNAARQKERRGLGYLFSRVFPPVYQVKEFYRVDSEKTHNPKYYYVKRLKSWLGKERRADLRQIIHDVMRSDKRYLDKTQKLFCLFDIRHEE